MIPFVARKLIFIRITLLCFSQWLFLCFLYEIKHVMRPTKKTDVFLIKPDFLIFTLYGTFGRFVQESQFVKAQGTNKLPAPWAKKLITIDRTVSPLLWLCPSPVSNLHPAFFVSAAPKRFQFEFLRYSNLASDANH